MPGDAERRILWMDSVRRDAMRRDAIPSLQRADMISKNNIKQRNEQVHKIYTNGVMAFGLGSCADDLDITPDGRLTMDEVWSNADYTESFLSSAFDQIPKKHVNYYWFDNLPSALSDDGWSCDDVEGVGPVLAYKGQGNAEENIFDHHYMDGFDDRYWESYWRAIRKVNMFLENIPTAAVRNEAARSRMIAEAKILRAYYYLLLVKWYGDIPIILDVPEFESDFAEYPKQPAWKVLQACVDDCEEALDNSEVPWRLANLSERNRMTRGTACAIISQASLFAASKLYCHGEDLWQYAYDKNKKVYDLLVANGFKLYTDLQDDHYNSAYAELFVGSPGYPVECERIMVGRPEAPNQPNYWVWGMPIQNNYRAGTVPTQELVDCFDVLSTGKNVLDYYQPYLDEQHLKPNFNLESGYALTPEKDDNGNVTGYRETAPFRDRDLRFEAVCIHNGSTVYVGDARSTVTTYSGGNCELRDNARNYTRTGYYNNKFRQWYSCANKRSADGAWVYFRFAEVMLNYAEAAVEKGDLPTAMRLINEVRHRAGFAPEVDLDPKGDRDLARLMLRKERRTEFVFEEHRFFDNRRWTANEENIECEKYTTGMKVTRSGIRYSYERFLVGSDGSMPSKLSYEAKWHFLPIPLDEVRTLEEKTGKKWQNYGW